jgi:hypothetical protein
MKFDQKHGYPYPSKESLLDLLGEVIDKISEANPGHWHSLSLDFRKEGQVFYIDEVRILGPIATKEPS